MEKQKLLAVISHGTGCNICKLVELQHTKRFSSLKQLRNKPGLTQFKLKYQLLGKWKLWEGGGGELCNCICHIFAFIMTKKYTKRLQPHKRLHHQASSPALVLQGTLHYRVPIITLIFCKFQASFRKGVPFQHSIGFRAHFWIFVYFQLDLQD